MAFIPSIGKNLIFVPILDKFRYSFLLELKKFNLYRDYLLIDNGILCGNLYILELYNLFSISSVVNIVSSTKFFVIE